MFYIYLSLRILPFREHERLIAYSRQVFYNAKIEAKVVLTTQREAYLFRVHSNEPDFSFILGKSIKIKEKETLVVEVCQFHKTMLLRE